MRPFYAFSAPFFYSTRFFRSFYSDSVFIPCAFFLSLRRLSVSTPQALFSVCRFSISIPRVFSHIYRLSDLPPQFFSIVWSRSFFHSLRFPSYTFHRRTLAPFLVPSSPVSISSQSPSRKRCEKGSLKLSFSTIRISSKNENARFLISFKVSKKGSEKLFSAPLTQHDSHSGKNEIFRRLSKRREKYGTEDTRDPLPYFRKDLVSFGASSPIALQADFLFVGLWTN